MNNTKNNKKIKKEENSNEIKKEHTYWLISGNPKDYNHKESFEKNGFIDWAQKKPYRGFKPNDIVYIFSSGSEQQIRFKAIVEKVGMSLEDCEFAEEFYTSTKLYEEDKKSPVFMRIKLLKESNDPSLKIGNLKKEKFLNQGPQGSKELLEGNFLKYLEEHFNDKSENVEMVKQNEERKSQEDIDNIPLNQILYGPPGTGKTFRTKEIIKDIIKNNKQKNNKVNYNFSNYKWYDVIALAMYKHSQEWYDVSELMAFSEIVMIYEARNIKNLRNTIWGNLQSHTSPDIKTVNYSIRSEPYLFEKNEDSKWKLTEEGKKYVKENLDSNIQDNGVEYSKFITFHQSYAYEDFIEGIKPECGGEDNSITYIIQNGIFKDICLKANNDPENNYVIVIDEINRGNISKIFGELITLIESDKRVTPCGEPGFEKTNVSDNQLLVTLPYSQKKFGVPNNLYIVGTMNTSDRSIASIDIALRRRFKFKEIMPDVRFVPAINVFNVSLEKLFTILNERISVLLDRDHQIGHSYFMKIDNEDTFKNVWYDSIMPLLNEYFYGDWEKLCALLGDPQDGNNSFIKKIMGITFANNYDCDDDESYDFVPENEIDFESALKNAFRNI